MSETATIHAAILAILSEIGHIGKDQRNKQQGFNFRGIDDVYNAVHPLMAKHGVYILPEVLETVTNERVTTKNDSIMNRVVIKVRHRFTAADGSFVDAITYGESMDAGDKASIKAQSMAIKTALLEIFAIPIAGNPEDRDPDFNAHQTTAGPTAAPPASPRQPECKSLAANKNAIARGSVAAVTLASLASQSGEPGLAERAATLEDKRAFKTAVQESLSQAGLCIEPLGSWIAAAVLRATGKATLDTLADLATTAQSIHDDIAEQTNARHTNREQGAA